MLQIIIILALVRLLTATNRPFLCAGIYTGVRFIFSFFSMLDSDSVWIGLLWLLVGTVIVFGLSSLYFWLLERTDGSPLWWVVLIGGAFIGLV